MVSLFLFIYFPNRSRLFSYPQGKPEPVSIVIPCYNEEKTIGSALESLLALEYPVEMLEIIVVDDYSQDNSAAVVRSYASKHKNIRLIVNPKNSGGAAEPTNIGIKAAKYSYIAVADADSTPEKGALLKMIGYLQENPKVGGVTCAVLAKHSQTFMQKLQEIEYVIMAFNRKLLDFIDAVYVTPGPFALYRKKVLLDIGLFDPGNLTQDIEIVWRMLAQGYIARMCLAARVYSSTPRSFRQWWRQRIRWNIGGTQCILKYKKMLFRRGMLGAFIIPFFSFSLFIGLFGLGLFVYLLTRRLLVSYLTTKYSLYASTAILHLEDFSFSPSLLNFFGFFLFFLSIGFSFFILRLMQRSHIRNFNIFTILFYSLVYLSVYPFNMVTSLYKLMRGKYSW